MNKKLKLAKNLFAAAIVIPPLSLVFQRLIGFLGTPVSLLGTYGEVLFLALSILSLFVLSIYVSRWIPGGISSWFSLFTRLISRVLAGNVEGSIYGLVGFFMMSASLFGWFADGVKESNLALAFGALFYSLSIALSMILVSHGIIEENRREFIPRHFISALSLYVPLRDETGQQLSEAQANLRKELKALYAFFSNADVSSIKAILDENEIPGILPGGKPKARPNFLPLLAVVYKHRNSLARVDIHFANDTFQNWRSKFLRNLFLATIRRAVKTLVPNAKVCVIPMDASAYDVVGLRKEVLQKYREEIYNRSHEMLFNLTPGTALMSVAYTLVALKKHAHGAYLRQDKQKRLYEAVYDINLTVTDLADIGEELEERATASLVEGSD